MKAELQQIREALEREIESHGDRIHFAVSSELRDDLTARKEKCAAALATINKLLAQPEQPMSIPIIEFRSKVSGLWYRNPQAELNNGL